MGNFVKGMAGARCAVAAAAWAWAGATCAASQLSLEPRVDVPAGVVTLGQIAVVRAATPLEADRLRALPVARLDANAPGRLLARLEVQRIVDRLVGPGAEALAWDGAQAVRLQVRRAAAGPMVVARSDAVTLVGAVGVVRLEQPATALADGRAGDVIGARLPSGAIVRARVQGAGKLALQGAT